MLHKHQLNAQPAHNLVSDAPVQVICMKQVRDSLGAPRAALGKGEESPALFPYLVQLAQPERHREEYATQTDVQQTIFLSALASFLMITIFLSGLMLWRLQTEHAAISIIYARLSPAVANIQVTSAGVTGSGVVFDKQGHVLTSYHVIRDAQSDRDIAVQLPGLGQVPARLIGWDLATDLAVLKVDAPPKRLTVAPFGDSDNVQVGDLAVALGNPYGLSHSLSVGYISAVGRRLASSDPYAPDVAGVLQTDAAINPGNSGGPLFNANGRVIGLNTRIESPSGGSVGIGFAIPSRTALQVARELMAHGYVRRPFLGVAGRPTDASQGQEHGLVIQGVYPGSPAARIGLRAGARLVRLSGEPGGTTPDVVLAIDGQPVRNQSGLNHLVAQHAIGDRITLEVLRDNRHVMFEADLSEYPATRLQNTLTKDVPSRHTE